MSSDAGDRVIAVIHGVATRDEAAFRAEVDLLAENLDIDARFVPVYWGDITGPDDRIESVLPYPYWEAGGDPPERDQDASERLRQAFRDRDLEGVIDDIAAGWRRRSAASRRRILGGVYGLVREQYLKASAQFTGDLIYYHRHRGELWGRVWETLMREAPGAGLRGQPVTVIGHSLGTTLAFDMAMEGEPRLHIDHLFSCATQTPFFHVIGCSPPAIDPTAEGAPVRLPDRISRWTNFYVALDPWAYVAAPVFTLADDTKPNDLEVHAGTRDDRIATHFARHYLRHATVIDEIRRALAPST